MDNPRSGSARDIPTASVGLTGGVGALLVAGVLLAMFLDPTSALAADQLVNRSGALALPASLLQVGFLFVPERVVPDFGRVDLLRELQRLLSLTALMRLACGTRIAPPQHRLAAPSGKSPPKEGSCRNSNPLIVGPLGALSR